MMDDQTLTFMPLNSKRFREIVAAYGASPARWPQGERAAAEAFVAQNRTLVQPWLEEAAQTDRFLDQLSQARAVTHDAVILPFPTLTGSRVRSRVSAAFMLATGLGLAACIAGAVLGVNLSLMSLNAVHAQTVSDQVQFLEPED
jgi:hypothetical protein